MAGARKPRPRAEAENPSPLLSFLGEERRGLALCAAVLAVVVVVAYSGVLKNEFIAWDDDLYVTDNPHVRAPSLTDVKWMLTASYPHWHPLAWAAHAADWALFGTNPAGHHATSVVLHAVDTILVFLLFVALLALADPKASDRKTTIAGSLAAALLFGLHPLRVESVAWASQKKDLLCALFMILAVLASLVSATSPPAARRRWFGGMVVMSLLALACKPMAVTIGPLLLVLDWYPLRRLTAANARELLREKGIVILLGLGLALGTLTVKNHVPFMRQDPSYRTVDRALMAIHSSTFYLGKTLWPANLVPFYPVPVLADRNLGNPSFAASLAGALLITGAALVAWRRGHPAFLGTWVGYLLMILPVSGVVRLAGVAAADRYSYTATLGFYALAAAGLARLGRGRLAAALVVLMVSGALLVRTRQQIEVWHDSETFWTSVERAFPGQVLESYNNLGSLYLEQALKTGDVATLGKAEEQLDRAVELFPDHPNAYHNLGVLHHARGDLEGAERLLRKAVQMAPTQPGFHGSLARLLEQTGRHDEAAQQVRIMRELAKSAP